MTPTLIKTDPVYMKPAQYDETNQTLVRDSKVALEKYSHLLRWKEEERVVDIGCGTGNVTSQIILPHLPADYKLLVGLDISEYNVKYATEKYSGPHITYLQGDIIEPDFQKLKQFFEKENINIGFDKVFSFHCFHWTSKSALWSKNIYSLLKPGGQTFIQFFTHSSFIELWIEAAFSDRWSPYTKAVGPIRSEFHYSTDVNSELTKVMTDAGFTVLLCEHRKCYVDKKCPTFIRLMKTADPYVQTIPEDLRSDYFEDLDRVYYKYSDRYAETGIPYTLVVVVACKPEN